MTASRATSWLRFGDVRIAEADVDADSQRGVGRKPDRREQRPEVDSGVGAEVGLDRGLVRADDDRRARCG